MTLEHRIASLERAARLMQSAPIILIALDPHEAGYTERQAEIEQWKASGRTVAIIHEARGYELWDAGQLVTGGIEDAA